MGKWGKPWMQKKKKKSCEQNCPSMLLSKGRLWLAQDLISFTQLQPQKYDLTAWAAAGQCRISFFLFVCKSIPSSWCLKWWKTCTEKGRKIKGAFSIRSSFLTDLWIVALHSAFSLLQSIFLPHHGCTSGAPSRKFSCQIAPDVLQKAYCSFCSFPSFLFSLGLYFHSTGVRVSCTFGVIECHWYQ